MTAHMWLNLAVSQMTGATRARAVEARDLAAERLTRDALIEAQRRAQEWNTQKKNQR